MKQKMLQRMLCGLLAWVLVLGYIPVPAHAAQIDGLCPHHTQHTPECGYFAGAAGSPCTHVCDAGCYQTVTQCTHVHGDCGYVPAVPGQGCGCVPDENGILIHVEGCGYAEPTAEVPCGHVCSAESGCVAVIPDCHHVHDDSCGYVAESPESPCTYQCAECQQAAADQAAADAVAALIAELPTVEALRAMTAEEQQAVYNQLQAVLNAYNALTGAQKALVPNAEAVLLPLLEYFDSLGSADDPETGNDEDVEAIQALIDGLPTSEEVQAMPMEEQLEAYNQVQSVYTVYDALTDDQKAQISNAEETFGPLFDYFNSLTDLAATHSHPVCGVSGCADGHSSYSWTAWDGTSSINGTRFYLTQDVTRTTEYYISGTVWICLNGHTINTGDNAYGLTVNPGATLIITDCQGSGMVISGSGMPGVENNGSFVLWNGTISGEDMGIFSYDGKVSIRGGSVTASSGDGIQLSSSSVSVENGSVYGYFSGITNNDSDCTIKVTGEATVKADGTEVVLCYFDREDTVQILPEHDEEWEGYVTVLVDGSYAHVKSALLLPEGKEPYEAWDGYAKKDARLFDNFCLRGEGENLNTNTAVHVVADLEICYLVTVKGEFGYMAKDLVSPTQTATYSAPAGGGGQEWSDPVL